jgi:N-acyl-D-amino-acid deacylase
MSVQQCQYPLKKVLVALGLFLALLGLSAPPRAQVPGGLPAGEFPITGKAGPGLEAIDEAMKTIMNRHGIPGGAIALAKDGRLVFAKGYGWADLTGEPARADMLFGLASLSKPITALAILKLIEEGKLKLDDRWFDILRHIAPPRNSRRMDPRLKTITVRQLLNHSGGWDRKVSGDPVNFTVPVARRLGVRPPVSAEQLISFMLEIPLDFDPGSEVQYSNLGFIILGEVIEKVSGLSYEDYVRKNVLEPMGVRKAGIHPGPKYFPGEARCYLAGTDTLLPPMHLSMARAAAGWSASPVDMVRFLTALDGSRGKAFLKERTLGLLREAPPPPLKKAKNGNFPGLGFEIAYAEKDGYGWFQDGNWYGMRTFMKRSPRGVNWVLALNASMQPDLLDRRVAAAAVQQVKTTVERIGEYPKVDFFGDFR